MAREISADINPNGINVVFDEAPGRNSFLALREVRWTPNGNYRLDLRKWFTDSVGNETPGKGVAFMTEQGPSNLIGALLTNGYGDTRQTLDSIKDRDDFLVSVKEVLHDNNMDINSVNIRKHESTSAEFYDPKSILV